MKRTRQTILPGKAGTKKLIEKYGSKLINVRYRYDYKNRKRLTTVEIIVDVKPYIPKHIPADKLVNILLKWSEHDLARKIKEAGGKWNNQKRAWEIPYHVVKALKIRDRIVG
jgi:hypothetical protein